MDLILKLVDKDRSKNTKKQQKHTSPIKNPHRQTVTERKPA